MSASISDAESDDWNVVSGEWRSYLKSEDGDIDDSIINKAIDYAQDNEDASDEGKEMQEGTKEPISNSKSGPELDSVGFNFDSLSNLKKVLSEKRSTFTILIESIVSLLFLYYSYTLVLDYFYKYKISNMMGSIEELPANAGYIELHTKRCNEAYFYYQDVLDSCLDSNTDDASCLVSYMKLVQKNAKFCSWDPEKIHKQQQLHVVYKHGREILERLTETSMKLVNTVGENFIEKGSQQWESLKSASQKVGPYFKKQLLRFSRKENELTSFLAKKNKDLEVKKNLENFVKGGEKVVVGTYESVRRNLPLIWDSAKDKTESGVQFISEYINRENAKKVYDGVFGACDNAIKNLLALF